MLKEIIYTIAAFLVIDIAWIQLVVSRLYRENLSSDILASSPKLAPAVTFYLVFCLSLWYLVIKDHSGDLKETLLRALVFGVATYATYTLTNFAVLNEWNLKLAITDIAWGGVLAVLVTYVVILLR